MNITGFSLPTKEEPEDMLEKKADLIYDVLDELIQEAHNPMVHSCTLAPDILNATLNEVLLPAGKCRFGWNKTRHKEMSAKAIVTKA